MGINIQFEIFEEHKYSSEWLALGYTAVTLSQSLTRTAHVLAAQLGTRSIVFYSETIYPTNLFDWCLVFGLWSTADDMRPSTTAPHLPAPSARSSYKRAKVLAGVPSCQIRQAV